MRWTRPDRRPRDTTLMRVWEDRRRAVDLHPPAETIRRLQPIQNMSVRYTAAATATAGRQGYVRSDDGVLDLELSVPEGVGGPGGPGTNPEQLFAAGYAACFGSAVRSVAARENLSARAARITAKVSLVAGEDGTFGLGIELVGTFPGIPDNTGMALMRAAHEICPYSNATRGNVDVQLSVE